MSATIRRVNMQQQTAHRSPTVALAPGSKVGKAKVQLQKSLSLAQPKEEAQKAATDGAKAKPKQRRVTESEDCPMYKVLLLGDEGYEREHVIMAIQDIIPETDNKKSTEIFEEAQKTGTGMCGVFPEEHAELYVQQFTRCEPMIYADMEEE
ncbi:hypothetical protein JKP88DRAFT_283579 [Tribonema minus]|uniref:Adaptor protein ClpS core domain-containing protein n=1 Tax=Tribonema minus TaxID=303371 RepID=A0A836C8I8_9STRA|nr:hypothetical protein JKP88DRAFT_283579 [Tribonema minus]